MFPFVDMFSKITFPNVTLISSFASKFTVTFLSTLLINVIVLSVVASSLETSNLKSLISCFA